MKLHLTILLSAAIISTGLVLAARQAHDVRPFADDLLPSRKTISRADVIKAMEQLDKAKLLAALTNPASHVSTFRVMDARAALDGKRIAIFCEATAKDGARSSPLNFYFEQDEFGRWVINADSGQIVLPL